MSARRSFTALAALCVIGLAASGCSTADGAANAAGSSGHDAQNGDQTATADPSAESAPPAQVSLNVAKANVPVDTALKVAVAGGSLDSVKVKGQAEGKSTALAGDLADGTWTASDLLEPGTSYTVTSVSTSESGQTRTQKQKFTTQELSLDEQTYPSVSPLQGETVGVGMPVIVNFDLPVTDKASIEKHLSVTPTPAQAGSWHWVSDTEVHWRPKEYWQAGTDVKVDVNINSVPAGGGIYGQENRSIDFHVGSANIYKVDVAAHQMKVYTDGALVKTLPITAGKDGFTTRSGTKVIMEKFASRRMNSETVGIPQGSSESYDIDNVQYAMRLTNSGEFIHAAPWSVGSQGVANVSHGCTGLSTDNASWLYSMTKRGDVVEYTGTDRPMTVDNGWGDWNESFRNYQQGSAL